MSNIHTAIDLFVLGTGSSESDARDEALFGRRYRTALVLAVVILCSAISLSADIVDGVASPRPSFPVAPVPKTTTAPPPSAVVINFDDRIAPCTFRETAPLTLAYSASGITFQGPAANSGGAILNQCGNFSVSGFTSPNFLAFNTNALYPSGGVPTGPETIMFSYPVDFVQIDAGHGNSGTITLQCFTGSSSVGSSSIAGSAGLASLSVQGPRISRCTVEFTGTALVVDNLAFVPSASIPAIDARGLLLLAALLALCGAVRLGTS